MAGRHYKSSERRAPPIYYVHVKRSRNIPVGHYFVDDAFMELVEAGRLTNRRWYADFRVEKAGKERPAGQDFESIEAVRKFVSEYYERPVHEITCRELVDGMRDNL